MVTDLRRDPQEFLDFMGLKGYEVNNFHRDSMIDIAKISLREEFFKDYALPQAGKTAVESIEKVIPGGQAKSIKEGIYDAVEFASDMVGDTDRGHLRIEYDCTSLSDCHIKGVYREYEDSKEITSEKTEEATKKNIEIDESGKAIYEHESNISLDQTNTFDSTIAAQETLAELNLTDFSQSNENASEVEMA